MKRTPLEAWIAFLAAGGGEGRDAATFDRSTLERYQLRRLRETLDLARARSSFYRRHLAGTDLDLASIDDLRRLPFTTAGDIRANPLGLVCVSQDEISRVVTLDSSGTTGPPKRLYFTRADQALTVDFFRVGMSTFTGPGDRVLILLPGETPGSVGDLLATALRDLGAVPIRHGPVRDPGQTLRIAAQERVSVMVGVPTHVLRLARHAPAAPALPHLHSILLSTDHVPAAIVAEIERTWDCRVYNHYGATEMGLGGGVDCAARRGYHLREADLLFEIVDPGNGEPVAGGAEGEVVFTTLTRVGMPLVRYRTGDLSRWLAGPCPCGTGLRTLAHVTTRVGAAVPLGTAGLLAQADLDEAVFGVEGVLDFAGSVTRPGTRAALAIRVEAAQRPSAVVRDEVDRALRTVPVIVGANASGDLASIEVIVGSGHVSGPTLAKRSVRDADCIQASAENSPG